MSPVMIDRNESVIATLDYAQRAPSRTWRRIVISVAIVVALFVSVFAFRMMRMRQAQAAMRVRVPAPTAFCFIDSDVKGTQVFLRGHLIGTVPLSLSQADFTKLGLPVGSPSLQSDGWGESLFAGVEDQQEEKLMLKAPDAVATQYLAIETPWGRRTKINGGEILPNGFVCHMMPADRWGATVTITAPVTVPLGSATANIHVVLANISDVRMSGSQPSLELHWGGFDTPWRNRSYKKFPLADVWSSLEPGETREADLTISVPTIAGDYSAFATFDLQADNESTHLIRRGTVYSNSVMLRVR